MSTKHIHWLLAIIAADKRNIENCIARISKPATKESPILLSVRIPERIYDNLEDWGYIRTISNDGVNGKFTITKEAEKFLRVRNEKLALTKKAG